MLPTLLGPKRYKNQTIINWLLNTKNYFDPRKNQNNADDPRKNQNNADDDVDD